MENIKTHKNSDHITNLHDVMDFFENHPASFIILGILLYLIAAQALKFQIGSAEIILISPTSKSLKGILLFFGIFAFFIGIYCILAKWNRINTLTTVVLIIFFLASFSFVFYTIYSEKVESPFPLTSYGYKLRDSSFYVTLDCEKLDEYRGSHLICVIRKSDASIAKQLDSNIDISNLFPLKTAEGCITIKTEATRIKDKIKLGDRIECYIFSIPFIAPKINIRKIEDITNIGGKFVHSCSSLVAIVESSPAELAKFYQKLDENSKIIFREMAGLHL